MNYPEQVILKSGQRVVSKNGANGVIIDAGLRTNEGFKLYKILFSRQINGVLYRYKGVDLLMEHQISACCEVYEI